MARFEIEANGRRFEVEAPDMDTALNALAGPQSGQDRIDAGFDASSDDPRLQTALEARATGKPQAGFGDRFNNAATFGISKDMAALAHAGPREVASWFTGDDYDFTDAYSRARSGEAARLDEYANNNPNAALAADVSGIVGGAGATVARGIVAAPTLLGRVGQGAKGGAVAGGLAGLGESESNNILDRWLDAGEGAALGAGIGAGLPVAAAGAGVAAKPIVDIVRSRTNPSAFAAEKVAQRLASGGRSPDVAARRIEAARSQGQNLSLADVGGENVRDLARTVSNVPGPGRARIRTTTNLSALSQGERLKRIVGDVFGNPGEGYQAAKQTIMDLRSSAAKPYYDRAYQTPVPYTFELESLLKTPAGRAGLAAAKRNTANRREPWAQFFAQVADDGTITSVQRVPDSRALDEVKRVLDNMVEAAKRPADGSPFAKALNTPESIAIQSVRDDLLNFLKTNNKPYAKALEVGGDNIRANEALEFGRNALNEDSRVIARKMGDPKAYGRDKVLDEGEKELARLGLAEALREKIDSAGWTHNAILKFFRNNEQVARLKPFFRTPDDYQRFRSQILNEARKRATVDAVRGNSTTARQLLDAQDAGQGVSEAVGIGAQTLTSGPVAGAISALQAGLRRMGGLTPKVADHMAKMLMSAEPQVVRGILTKIQQIESAAMSAANKRGQIRALLTQFAGGQQGRGFDPRANGLPAPARMLPAPR